MLQLQEHSYVPDAKASGAKTLRKSLTKLAHRFVPGAVAKGSAAPRPALSDHTFLPEPPAKNAQVRWKCPMALIVCTHANITVQEHILNLATDFMLGPR